VGDGQTDRQTQDHSIYHSSTAWRAKNRIKPVIWKLDCIIVGTPVGSDDISQRSTAKVRKVWRELWLSAGNSLTHRTYRFNSRWDLVAYFTALWYCKLGRIVHMQSDILKLHHRANIHSRTTYTWPAKWTLTTAIFVCVRVCVCTWIVPARPCPIFAVSQICRQQSQFCFQTRHQSCDLNHVELHPQL